MSHVYRVEAEDGLGPYRTRTVSPHANMDWTDVDRSDRHPTPWEEGLYAIAYNWRHGFASLRHLRRWFTKADRRKMAGLGFRVVKYRVPAWASQRGKRQVIFHYPSAQPLKTLDIVTLE